MAKRSHAGWCAQRCAQRTLRLVIVRPWTVTPPGFWIAAVWFLLVALAGLAGSLVDSLLGATPQAIYFCPVCHKETERHRLHCCGAATMLHRGLSWLNNDWVNAACTLSGALLALISYILLSA